MEQGTPSSTSHNPLPDFDAVCQSVRTALEPARVHAVSLHDETGEVMWLTEGSMGPDEHNAVVEAFEAFNAPNGVPVFDFDLGDSRSAVLFRVVNARRAMAGAIMVVMDTRGVRQGGKGPARLMNPKLQRALGDFAGSRAHVAPQPTVELVPERASPTASAPAVVNTAPRPPSAATGSRRPLPSPSAPTRGVQSSQPRASAAPVPAAVTAGSAPAAATNPSKPATPVKFSLPNSYGIATIPSDAPPTAQPPPAHSSLPFELTLADSMRMPAPPMPPPMPARQPQAPPQAQARAPVQPDPQRQPQPRQQAQPPPQTPPPTRVPPPLPATARHAAAGPPPMASYSSSAPPPKPIAPIPALPLEAGTPAVLVEKERRALPRENVSPEIDRLHAQLRSSPIVLHVQHLVPLTKGGQLKRYEVLLRSQTEERQNVAPQAMLKTAVDHGLGSMIDRRVLTELVGWLVRHPQLWRGQAAMFSVNLTSTALRDEHFLKFVELCLAKASLPMGTIAFEIGTATTTALNARVLDVGAALHRLGCPLILDDFGMRTECFELLRLPAVKYIKLDSEITGKMRTDKVAQAAITAVVQMSRVLSMQTVAKRTQSPAEHEWLTALGVDFAQSNALSPAVAIDMLLTPASPTE